MVTAPKQVVDGVVDRRRAAAAASPLRASGGTDWLSARSMSSRSGAVYCVPVRPVRSSTVSAAVRPHSLPVRGRDAGGHARRRSGRADCRRSSAGSGADVRRRRRRRSRRSPRSAAAVRPGRTGWTVASVGQDRLRVVGRQVPRPAAASGSGCGVRLPARRPRHSTDASASCRRATAESCCSGTSSDGVEVRRRDRDRRPPRPAPRRPAGRTARRRPWRSTGAA